MNLWQCIAEALEHHRSCVVVTVAEVRGSAPREAGARMLVLPGGGFRGTIGGGALEWQAIASATDALRPDAAGVVLSRHALGPELGQCCGGSVRLLTERFDRRRLAHVNELARLEQRGEFVTRGRIDANGVSREVSRAPAGPRASLEGAELVERFGESRRRVYLFGAGHVGRALMLALAPLPFDLTWIDERENAFPSALPANVGAVHAQSASQELKSAPDGAFVVVMTHSHPLDLEIVHAALAAERFDYVGLIGSTSKRARFTRQLRDAGLTESTIETLVCPIGVRGIASKHPCAIAVAVAAELLARNETAGASS